VCEGHGRCAALVPAVFVYSDLAHQAMVGVDDVPAELEAQVRDAAATCPAGAIIVSED
jgi:ferredoxin